MTMLPMPGNNFPVDFNDPLYEQLARRMEQMHNLPRGILDAIRTRGERSNANQVSEAGARTPYQVIPATRRGVMKNYGVDAWGGPENATEAAALILKENFGRTGDWNTAITQYHGGTNPRNWGPRTRAYANRVGSFNDAPQGEQAMSPAYNDIIEIPDSYNPRYGQRTEPVPIPGDPGISKPVAPTAEVTTKKKRGLLGSIGSALGSVFMPEPDSLWAAALRGGIYDAKANQAAYKRGVAAEELDLQEANIKLRRLMQGGEYKVAGNNLVHYKPDGTAEIIQPPATLGEKERLIDQWRRLDESDPAKQLIERILLSGNSDEALRSRETQASTRAGATTRAAQIRASSSGKSNATDQYEYKVINGKLMRRRKN